MQNAKAKKNQVKPAANNCLFIFMNTMLISSFQVLRQIFAQIMLKVIVFLMRKKEKVKRGSVNENYPKE